MTDLTKNEGKASSKVAISTTLCTFLLAFLSMLGPFSVDAYLPSFTAIEKEFSVTPVMMQQTLSIYLCSFAVMNLCYGTLSDIYGRKRIVLACLSVYACASLIAAFSPSYGFLLGARFLQGTSVGAGMVIGQAIVRDLYDGAVAQALMATIAMVFAIAPAVAPVLGGYLEVWFGWRSVFCFLILYSVTMLFMIYRFLPETLPPENRQKVELGAIVSNYKSCVTNARFMCSALAASLSFGGAAVYISCCNNIVLNILGKSVTDFGWIFIPQIGGTFIGSWLCRRYGRYFSIKTSIDIGIGVMLLGGILSVIYAFVFTPSLPWLPLPMMVYTIGMSICRPGLNIVTMDVFPKALGMGSAVISFLQTAVFAIIAGALAPFLFDSLKLINGALMGFVLITAALWFIGARGGGR